MEREECLMKLQAIEYEIKEVERDLQYHRAMYELGFGDITDIQDLEDMLKILEGARNYIELLLIGEDCSCLPINDSPCYFCRMHKYYQQYAMQWK